MSTQHRPVDNLPTEYVDLYFDGYARIAKEKPPREEDLRLHALLYKRWIAVQRERHGLLPKFVRFLRDNRLVRWLASTRGGPP